MLGYVEGSAQLPEDAEQSRASGTLHLVLFKYAINT